MLKKTSCIALLIFCQSTWVFANTAGSLNSISTSTTPIAKQTSSKNIIPSFSATYNIIRQHDIIGTGIRTLSYLENGRAKYSYQTNIDWLIFSDKRIETSIVSLKDYKVSPFQYHFEREGTGRDKSQQWQYNLAENQALNQKTDEIIAIDFPENIQDKLSYHLQNRLNLINKPKQKHFVYPVISSSGSLKNYVYQYDGEEEIMVPFGLFKAIRLKREVIEKKRITYAWFVPELNYLMVKLFQIKAGVEQFEVQLTDLQVDQ